MRKPNISLNLKQVELIWLLVSLVLSGVILGLIFSLDIAHNQLLINNFDTYRVIPFWPCLLILGLTLYAFTFFIRNLIKQKPGGWRRLGFALVFALLFLFLFLAWFHPELFLGIHISRDTWTIYPPSAETNEAINDLPEKHLNYVSIGHLLQSLKLILLISLILGFASYKRTK